MCAQVPVQAHGVSSLCVGVDAVWQMRQTGGAGAWSIADLSAAMWNGA